MAGLKPIGAGSGGPPEEQLSEILLCLSDILFMDGATIERCIEHEHINITRINDDKDFATTSYSDYIIF